MRFARAWYPENQVVRFRQNAFHDCFLLFVVETCQHGLVFGLRAHDLLRGGLGGRYQIYDGVSRLLFVWVAAQLVHVLAHHRIAEQAKLLKL